MNLRPALVCLFGALSAGLSLAQFPAPHHPPMPGPSPLLFVRFTGPPGMRATFFQGRAPARSFPAPVVVGVRPGYLYRVGLTNLPDHPGLSVFPTLEIRGALHLPPHLGAAGFPATVHLSPEDVEAAAAGSLVTKAIYLENPDRAEPRATRPGEIIEHELAPNSDLAVEVHKRGRVMILVHLGRRVPTAEELVQQNAPGTILFPGEKALGFAAAKPTFPIVGVKFYDPRYGPKRPEEECLHDGGDRYEPAAFGGDGELRGLDPEDTVAEFADSKGRKCITCSNRVCLCVPRYAALRKELPLALREGVIGPGGARLVMRQEQYEKMLPSELALQYERLHGYKGRLRPSVNVNQQALGVLIGLKVLQAQHVYLGPAEYVGRKEFKVLSLRQRAELLKQLQLVQAFQHVSAVAGVEQVVATGVITGVKTGSRIVETAMGVREIMVCCHEAPCPPDKPLCLVKCADRSAAQVGDVVTFTLRYSNVGGRPISDIAVSDSLSGRLEYVEGSAESDRDAVFTMQPNEVGSVILRWEVSGRLQPGQSGRLRFKARVR
jgi:uncharacterized repeat protein (TIGR01451 family)